MFQYIIRRLFSHRTIPLHMSSQQPLQKLQQRAKPSVFQQTKPKSQVPLQPDGVYGAMVQWPPSYGVSVQELKLHCIMVSQLSSYARQRLNLDVNLIKQLEIYWPDLKSYGSPEKYKKFWHYEWNKHGHLLGISQSEFFQKAVAFMKGLPPLLGLKINTLMTINEVVQDLHTSLKVKCGLSSSKMRGYVCQNEEKIFAVRVLDEVKIAINIFFNYENMWRLYPCEAKGTQRIILPRDAVERCTAPEGELLYIRGQPEHTRYLNEEYIKRRNREFIYSDKLVPFEILEKAQSMKKCGVLVVSAAEEAYEYKHEQELHNHVKEAFKIWGRLNMTFIIVVKDVAGIDEEWDESRYRRLESRVTKSVFSSLQHCVRFVPISHDTNITRKVENMICTWWRKGCLYTILEKFELPDKDNEGALRLSIIDKFEELGVCVIVGRVESGTLRPHDILVTPSQIQLEVLQIFEGEDSKLHAYRGDFVQVHVSRDDKCLVQGCVLTIPGCSVPLVSEFDAILSIEDLGDKEFLRVGSKVELQVHYATTECTILCFLQPFDLVTKAPIYDKTPTFVKNASLVSARLQVIGQSIYMENNIDVSGLGGFVLKLGGRNIASGKVIMLRM